MTSTHCSHLGHTHHRDSVEFAQRLHDVLIERLDEVEDVVAKRVHLDIYIFIYIYICACVCEQVDIYIYMCICV
jgi:hypothetical protein